MERKTLTEYFEEVETKEEYNGYFCSIAEATSLVVLGSLCGLKNVSSPLHIISAQICELGITLASETVADKSNEIPAVQELLKKMDIEGCMIVADALNYQQKTADIIVDGKGDYLLDAKGNQASLETEISEYVLDSSLRDGMDSSRTKEKNRDRIETRTAYTTDNISWLYGKEKWKDLRCIGAIKTEFEKDGKNPKSDIIISPAVNSRQRSFFVMLVWSGQ